jgi:hypothetical protein
MSIGACMAKLQPAEAVKFWLPVLKARGYKNAAKTGPDGLMENVG